MSYFRGSKNFAVPLLRFALAILPLASPAVASSNTGSVSVAWNPNPEANISGYKIYWGESSRQYTKVQDAGNMVQATLSNLTAGQTYFCAVTAYNTAGQESPYSAEISLAYAGEPAAADSSSRLILLEAESGQLGSPMTVYGESGFSYVATSSYSTSGWAQIPFNAPLADDYHVWCRVKAPTAATDSFGVTMDGGAEDVFHVYGAPEPADGIRSNTWIWKKIHLPGAGPRVYTLSAAAHTIRFRSREPGAQIERIVFTNDPSFVPTDSLPRSGDALAVTRNPVSLVRDAGQSAVFSVGVASTGPVTYQWKKNGAALPGANSASLVLATLNPADTGSYSVELIHGSTSLNVGPASLTVHAVLPETVFRVSRMTMNPDRTIGFQIEGELNANILVYASSDLENWNLISVQLNQNGQVTVSDPGASGKTQRFYRLESESTAPLSGSASDRTPTPEGSPDKAGTEPGI